MVLAIFQNQPTLTITAMNYFRKSVPATPVWISNGSKVVFSTNDKKTGYYATDNPFIIGQLELAQRENRGGVVSISAEQYDAEFIKKKGLPIPPRPVTELRAGPPPNTITSKSPDAPPAAPSVKMVTMEPEVKEFTLEPVPVAKPRIGKRKAPITS